MYFCCYYIYYIFVILRYFVDEKPIWDGENLDNISIDKSTPQYTGGIIKVCVYYFNYMPNI